MSTSDPSRRPPRGTPFRVLRAVLWTLLVGSLVFWVTTRLAPPPGGELHPDVQDLIAAPGAPGPEPRLAPGKLLIASRDLGDPYFRETVVLLLRYGEGGAIGLVLNRQGRMPVGHLLPEPPDDERAMEPIFVGGPVKVGELFFLFGGGEADSAGTRILDGVRASQSVELLESILAGRFEVDRLRVFGGYAGWGPGQLESELDRGGWRLLRGSQGVVFDPNPVHLWRRLTPRADGLEVRIQADPAKPGQIAS